MDVRLVVTGSDELVRKLRTFISRGLDLSDSMDETGTYLNNFFSGQVFASRGQVIGRPWPALNPSYAAWKAEQFPGRPPLIRTGLMQRSFKHKSTPLTTSLWNEAEYFDYHNEGWGVPQRMMMRVDEQRTLRVASLIADDITGQLKKAGLV